MLVPCFNCTPKRKRGFPPTCNADRKLSRDYATGDSNVAEVLATAEKGGEKKKKKKCTTLSLIPSCHQLLLFCIDTYQWQTTAKRLAEKREEGGRRKNRENFSFLSRHLPWLRPPRGLGEGGEKEKKKSLDPSYLSLSTSPGGEKELHRWLTSTHFEVFTRCSDLGRKEKRGKEGKGEKGEKKTISPSLPTCPASGRRPEASQVSLQERPE